MIVFMNSEKKKKRKKKLSKLRSLNYYYKEVKRKYVCTFIKNRNQNHFHDDIHSVNDTYIFLSNLAQQDEFFPHFFQYYMYYMYK